MTVVTQANMNVTATQTDTLDLGQRTFPASLGVVMNMTSGTTAGKADLVWSDTRTITAADNLDLAGVLTDAFGTSLTFARVKMIVIKAASTNTVNVHVGGHATAAVDTLFANTSDILVVRPGGAVMVYAPDATAYAVTATTADMLTIAPSDGSTSTTYDIMVIGASA